MFRYINFKKGSFVFILLATTQNFQLKQQQALNFLSNYDTILKYGLVYVTMLNR